MELWKSLYLLIWLAFLQFILVVIQTTFFTALVDVHLFVGIAVLAVAHMNSAKLKATAAPGRVKRIAKACANLATAQIVLGLVLFAGLVFGDGLTAGSVGYDVIVFLHMVLALAIITQASSAATAYDMWEEKEFLPPSEARSP